MIRFIHTADIHFGMENYGRIDPKTGIHSRLLDFDKALNFCIDKAIEENVDFFLFAGDAYKTAHPSPTQQRLLFQCFLRLFKADIPLIIIIGNHDNPLSFGKAHALELFGQLPLEGFHVISKPATVTVSTKSGPVQIVGIPWPSRTTVALNHIQLSSCSSELTQTITSAIHELICEHARKLDTALPAVLAAHLTVTSGIFSGSEKRAIYGTDPVFMPSQLAIFPFDYVALGHLHRYQSLNGTQHPPLVYSGSLERIDFGERKEEKGFCLVTIHNKEKTSYEFIKTPTRPFIQIEVQLNASQSHTEQILQAIKSYPIQGAVVKIVYHVPKGKKDRVDIVSIQQACSCAHYVVGIFPVRTPEVRERRISLSVDMNLSHLLDLYFATKPEFKDQRHELIKKALELEAELNSDEGQA